jgi:hypothetical protein
MGKIDTMPDIDRAIDILEKQRKTGDSFSFEYGILVMLRAQKEIIVRLEEIQRKQ